MSSNNKKKNTKPVENITNEEAVEITETVAEEKKVVSNKAVVANCERVNFRFAKSKDSDILDILDAGTEITAVKEGKWCAVEHDDEHGYIMSEFVKFV